MIPNQFAYLALLSHSEGTDRWTDSYRVCFSGRHSIVDFSDHPTDTGEWAGEPLDFLGGRYVGKVSTAAGRYQLRVETWREAKAALGLADFSPHSQDDAALWLIKRRGALADVTAGDILDAIEKCRNEWASLPGGTSGQPEMKLASCIGEFINSGGTLALAAP